MDVNDVRIAVTLISLLLFVALVLHTWSRSRRGEHEEAALLPFRGEVGPGPTGTRPQQGDAA